MCHSAIAIKYATRYCMYVLYALTTKDNDGQFMWVSFAFSNFVDANQWQIIRIQVVRLAQKPNNRLGKIAGPALATPKAI